MPSPAKTALTVMAIRLLALKLTRVDEVRQQSRALALRGIANRYRKMVAETETLLATGHEPSKVVISISNRLIFRRFSPSQGVTSGQG